MENGMMDTYDTPDGCVLSKMTTDKRSPARNQPLEYATSSAVRHLMNEQKFRSLPRLPRTIPTGDGDGLYSVASGDRSPHTSERSVSLYSEVSNQTSSSQHQPVESSDDLYSVVDKSAKKTKLPLNQSSAQQQDIYSVVDKSAKFRRGKSADQLSLLPAEESPGIAHRPVIKKKPVRCQQQQSPSEFYSVVQQKNKLVVHEDVYSEIGNPGATAHLSLNRHKKLPVQEQLYSVVNKPSIKAKPKRPPPEEIYSEVNKPAKPGEHNSELHDTPTSSENVPTPLRRTTPADLYDEVKPQQIENGDIYSVVNKPVKPHPVARKPDRQRRILSDSSVIMATKEDTVT